MNQQNSEKQPEQAGQAGIQVTTYFAVFFDQKGEPGELYCELVPEDGDVKDEEVEVAKISSTWCEGNLFDEIVLIGPRGRIVTFEIQTAVNKNTPLRAFLNYGAAMGRLLNRPDIALKMDKTEEPLQMVLPRSLALVLNDPENCKSLSLKDVYGEGWSGIIEADVTYLHREDIRKGGILDRYLGVRDRFEKALRERDARGELRTEEDVVHAAFAAFEAFAASLR